MRPIAVPETGGSLLIVDNNHDSSGYGSLLTVPHATGFNWPSSNRNSANVPIRQRYDDINNSFAATRAPTRAPNSLNGSI